MPRCGQGQANVPRDLFARPKLVAERADEQTPELRETAAKQPEPEFKDDTTTFRRISF